MMFEQVQKAMFVLYAEVIFPGGQFHHQCPHNSAFLSENQLALINLAMLISTKIKENLNDNLMPSFRHPYIDLCSTYG